MRRERLYIQYKEGETIYSIRSIISVSLSHQCSAGSHRDNYLYCCFWMEKETSMIFSVFPSCEYLALPSFALPKSSANNTVPATKNPARLCVSILQSRVQSHRRLH
ncbi:hypothetical protein XELAEV_18019227mg [Xenopus laevis]|uniref:Uncharacterized protein n=1 Tax=Xenopus laevis TaxID=8355 RepID=A0A974DFP4_XENLA|nr:hypothetical protein XELAEV_18019227mg [Xenopus laevis]